MTDSIAAMFDLSQKVALLTGAGRGIGLAMAQTLAAKEQSLLFLNRRGYAPLVL